MLQHVVLRVSAVNIHIVLYTLTNKSINNIHIYMHILYTRRYVHTMIRLFEVAGDKVKASAAHTFTTLLAEGTDDTDLDNTSTNNKGHNSDSNHEKGHNSDDYLASMTMSTTLSVDDKLRQEAVEAFLLILHNTTTTTTTNNSCSSNTSSNMHIHNLSYTFLYTMIWILGEYGYLSITYTKEQLIQKLCNICYINSIHDNIRIYIITAIIKIIAQNGGIYPKQVSELFSYYRDHSNNIEIIQRCHEYSILLLSHTNTNSFINSNNSNSMSNILIDVLPIDASCEDFGEEVRIMTFLDDYVQKAINNGGAVYNKPSDFPADFLDVTYNSNKNTKYTNNNSTTYTSSSATSTSSVVAGNKMSGLKIEAYEKPVIPTISLLSSPLQQQQQYSTNSTNNNVISTIPIATLSSSNSTSIHRSPVAFSSPSFSSTSGNQLLNHRLGGNSISGSSGTAVWSRNMPPPPPPPALATSITTANTNNNNTAAVSGINNSPGVKNRAPANGSAAVAVPVIVTPRQKTEKEKLAELLFTGIGTTGNTSTGNGTSNVLRSPASVGTGQEHKVRLAQSPSLHSTPPQATGHLISTTSSPVSNTSPHVSTATTTSPTATMAHTTTALNEVPAMVGTTKSPNATSSGLFAGLNQMTHATLASSESEGKSYTHDNIALTLTMMPPLPPPATPTPAKGANGGSVFESIPIVTLQPTNTTNTVTNTTPHTQLSTTMSPILDTRAGGMKATVTSTTENGLRPSIPVHSISDAFANMSTTTTSKAPSLPPTLPTPTSTPAYTPLVLTTAEFGQRWVTLKAEVKGTCHNSDPSLAISALLTKLPSTVYHHVETITSTLESIFASSLLTGDTVTGIANGKGENNNVLVVLIHIKLLVATREWRVTVRSTSNEQGIAQLTALLRLLS